MVASQYYKRFRKDSWHRRPPFELNASDRRRSHTHLSIRGQFQGCKKKANESMISFAMYWMIADACWWWHLPHGTILRCSISVPILTRSMNFTAIGAINDRTAPCIFGQSNPWCFVRGLRSDSHHHLAAIQMTSFTQIHFILILILISATFRIVMIFAIAYMAHGQFAAFFAWHALHEAREILFREGIEWFFRYFAGKL